MLERLNNTPAALALAVETLAAAGTAAVDTYVATLLEELAYRAAALQLRNRCAYCSDAPSAAQASAREWPATHPTWLLP